MKSGNLSRSLVFTAIAVLLCLSFVVEGQSLLQGYRRLQNQEQKQLAIFFKNLPADVDNGEPIFEEFRSRISKVLGFPGEILEFKTLKSDGSSGSYIAFSIAGDSPVVDSQSTPETYATFAVNWQNALTNDADLKANFDLSGLIVVVDSFKYEVILGDTSDDTYEEGVDPSVPTSSKDDLINAIDTRYEYLQMRLKSSDIKKYLESSDHLNSLVSGIRSAAGTILAVPDDRIILVSVKPGSVVVQFTVYPANQQELDSFSKKWAQAIAEGHPALTANFPDADRDYPGTILTGGTTTAAPTPAPSTDEDEGGNAGIVAGAVLGSLAGVALVGGGASAYMYKQKQKGTPGTNAGQDFGDRSPGADTLSPNGLSNVDIHGEATPNPHNYRG